MRRLILLVGWLLSATSATAQLVQGRVTERVAATPLAGVLVELLRTNDDSAEIRVAATLTGADGAYALLAPGAGRYHLTAKKIGVRRFRSASFELTPGQTIVRALSLDAITHSLPEVVVSGLTSCNARARDGPRVASLWEEARTALVATQLSLRDQLFRAHVTRYVRELDRRTRRVLAETRSQATGVVSRPFAAVDVDSLSAPGYWIARAEGGFTYYGPDADVLLSQAFLRDHCFREVGARRDRRRLVGLGFQPVATRTVPDVVGVMWLDDTTFELRQVDFAYSQVHAGADSASVGGEVHFARLASGAWIIRKWFIRLPVVARPIAPLTTEVSAAPWVLVRPVTLALREEGGDVAAEELVRHAAHASIRGVVRDSANRPFAGATVRPAGSRLRGTTGANGTFTIDSVPFGKHTLVMEHAGYDSLGLVAVDQAIEVSAVSVPHPTMRALNGRQLYARLCLGGAPRQGRGAIRLTVGVAGGGSGDSVAAELPVAIAWKPALNNSPSDSAPRLVESKTDARGQLTLCNLPARRALSLVVARQGGGSEALVITAVPDRGVQSLVVRLTPP